MDEVLFNSRSELDKLPFGAVKAGETLCVGIRLVCVLGVSNVRLVVWWDADGSEVEFLFRKVWFA